jgi:hypothetical protein
MATSIYHITCIDNLEPIARRGELLCDAEVRRLRIASTRIGHENLKDRRMLVPVPVGPQGALGDYVPFFFGPRPPMLYSIANGYVEGFQGTQSDVAHLVTTAEVAEANGLGFAFTNGHAVMAMSDFFDDLSDLPEIDWRLMGDRYWFDTAEDPDRKRRRQAEFLVYKAFPWRSVLSIGVKTQKAGRRAEQALEECAYRPPVSVHPEWYY